MDSRLHPQRVLERLISPKSGVGFWHPECFHHQWRHFKGTSRVQVIWPTFHGREGNHFFPLLVKANLCSHQPWNGFLWCWPINCSWLAQRNRAKEVDVGNPWEHWGQAQRRTQFYLDCLQRPSRSPYKDRVNELPAHSWQQTILAGTAAFRPPRPIPPWKKQPQQTFQQHQNNQFRVDQRFVLLRSDLTPEPDLSVRNQRKRKNSLQAFHTSTYSLLGRSASLHFVVCILPVVR